MLQVKRPLGLKKAQDVSLRKRLKLGGFYFLLVFFFFYDNDVTLNMRGCVLRYSFGSIFGSRHFVLERYSVWNLFGLVWFGLRN